MSHSKHTPGPWTWLGSCLEGPNYADVIGTSVNCGQWCQGGMCELKVSEADAKLIAAAPTLAERLRSIIKAYDGAKIGSTGMALYDDIEAARDELFEAIGVRIE